MNKTGADKHIPRNILLNPGPATTTDRVKHAQVVPDICPREDEFGNLVASLHEDLISFALDSKEHSHKYACVLLGGSGTAAVEAVICSVVPQNCALLVINNGAYGDRIIKIARIHKIPVVSFDSPNSSPIDYAALKQKLSEEHTRLEKSGIKLSHIAMVHHETTSGLLNNISPVGQMAREMGLELIVDAMSSYAGIKMDMRTSNISYLVSSSNKNLQGMAGVGIIICNKQAVESTKEIPIRCLYLNVYEQYAYFLKTKQFRFTPPVQTLYALKQAVEETKEETVSARYERYYSLYKLLRSGMSDMGFSALVADADSSGLITTFFEPSSPQYSFNHMHDYLYARGFTIYPGKVTQAKTFRIANIGAIDKNDISLFLQCLRDYLSEHNISLP